MCHGEDEFGVVTALTYFLVKGMHPCPSTPKFHGTTYELSAARDCPPDHHNEHLPKLNFRPLMVTILDCGFLDLKVIPRCTL